MTIDLKEALKDAEKEFGIQQELLEAKLIHFWKTDLHALATTYTVSIYLKKQVLFVTVANSAVKNDLFYQKTNFIEQLNAHVGKEIVKDIVFK